MVSQINTIPEEAYWLFVVVFCSGIIWILGLYGLKKGLRYLGMLFLAEYVALLSCFAIIFRETRLERKYDIIPFWSYDKPDLANDNMLNILMFVPIGFLAASLMKKHTVAKTIALCLFISASFEVLQLVFRRGHCDIDDIINNTFGGMIGCLLFLGCMWVCVIYRRLSLRIRKQSCIG